MAADSLKYPVQITASALARRALTGDSTRRSFLKMHPLKRLNVSTWLPPTALTMDSMSVSATATDSRPWSAPHAPAERLQAAARTDAKRSHRIE